MLTQRLRRLPNFIPALCQCIVFAGIYLGWKKAFMVVIVETVFQKVFIYYVYQFILY